LKPTTVTPDELFRTQRRYIIPLFQRGYVWNEADQWAPLWRDVILQTRKVEQADNDGGHAAALQWHFMGAIVLEPKPARVRHVADHAVVDGQQRLTTLQIVLVALRDVVSNAEDPDLIRDLSLLTFNEGQWTSQEEGFKLWPTNVGRSAWRQVIEAGSATQVLSRFPLQKQKVKRKSRWIRQPLAEAYLFFFRQISAYLQGGPGIVADDDDPEGAHAPQVDLDIQGGQALDLNRAKYLLEAITKYFQIVAIELEPNDDPQVIFETLNGRMAPLTAADLIRNFVFVASTRRGLDTEKIYEESWAQFDHDPGTPPDVPGFWRGSQKQGRRFHSRLDLFVFHYVTMRTGREIALGQLFHAFRKWWDEGDVSDNGQMTQLAPEGRDPGAELKRMAAVALSMRVLLDPAGADDDSTARFARRLQALDTTTPFPILLYLCERRVELGDDEYVGCLEDLESYLVRRALCQLTTKNYNQILLRALGAVRGAGSSTRTALQTYLLGLEGEASRWPTDDDVVTAVQLTPAYQALGPARAQMILQALELSSYTGREEGVTVPRLTVEHVMPQTMSSLEDWPYPNRTASPTLEQVQLRTVLRESLGNLTLVTQPLNSSLSNGTFAAKKAKLADESQLRMNRYFANFSRDLWLEQDILERGTLLGQKAIKIWARPEDRS
jgi:hypothetical protein